MTRRSRWIRPLLGLAVYGALVVLERRRPLRKVTHEPKAVRNARNVALAGIGAAALQLAAAPVLRPLSEAVERRRWGLLPRLGLPRALETAVGLVCLDYTLYLWHVLVHEVPGLWRFHRVHHADLDLDASTAVRFHFGELALSVGWNALEVGALGIGPRTFALRQRLLLLSILFHHADLELPLPLERLLARLVVTPRMHAIHHSIVPEETSSNWSSGLSLWDRLHGTLRLDVPQQEITIGVPAFREPREVTLPRLLAMPFGPQRPTWALPDGTVPSREPSPQPDRLLP